MIRQALVLAAGMGSRIRAEGDDRPKPLQRVRGVSLIKRTILSLAAAGIERVVVVVGFRANTIRQEILADRDYRRRGVEVDFVDNLDFGKSNGISVLAARDAFDGPFLLSMADHVFDAELALRAARADMRAADLHLCVDYRIAEIYDIDDATKVATDGSRICRIGKNLSDFDCIDCGVFAVSPALFSALEAALAERGDCSLSDGVSNLAARRLARVLDIGSSFWQDVDTQVARRHVEWVYGAMANADAGMRATGQEPTTAHGG